MAMIRTAAQILAEIGEDEDVKGPWVGTPLAIPCPRTGRTVKIKNYPPERKPRQGANRLCELVPGCTRKHRALGYCQRHYDNFRGTGSPYGRSGRPPVSPVSLGPIAGLNHFPDLGDIES